MPNPAKPTAEQWATLGMRITAKIRTDMIEDEFTVTSPAKVQPCMVAIGARSRICKNTEVHPAVILTTPDCGHSIAYCQAAAEFFIPRIKGMACHVCDRTIHRITTKELT
jgi:hypothetical protein